MLETVLTIVLIAVLAAAVLSFAVMGFRQFRHRRALVRVAHRDGMHFSATDPFNVARRYGDFALVAAGHSARAHNVTYGRLGGCTVRAFDFRYEVGHGTRRETRRYGALVIEADMDLPPAVLWNVLDPRFAPLGARRSDWRVGEWLCRGEASTAGVLARACGPFAGDGGGAEARGGVLLLWVPDGRRARRGYRIGLGEAERVLRAVKGPDENL